MPGTVLRGVRIRKDLDDWFNENFPWRGMLPQFVNACLEKFRAEWGDKPVPTPDQIAAKVAKAVITERY